MHRALLLAAAVVPPARGDYSYAQGYAYTDAPTALPTETFAPTRAETYAPTRMTEAPSYAPTTDTYAPTFSSCPTLKDPDLCPADAAGLPLCSQQGLRTGDLCVTGASICPSSGSTNCPAFSASADDEKLGGSVTFKCYGADVTADPFALCDGF